MLEAEALKKILRQAEACETATNTNQTIRHLAKELAGIGEAEAGIGGGQESRQNAFKLGQGGVNVQQNRTQAEANNAKNESLASLGSGIGGILTRIITNKKSPPKSGVHIF